MCGICGVKLLGGDLSDRVKGCIVQALDNLRGSDGKSLGIDGNVLAENNAIAAGVAYYLNVALNHRGRDSSGIFTYNGSQHHSHGGMGLAFKVFNLETLVNMPGVAASGHDRYATTGTPKPENIQPHFLSLPFGNQKVVISLAHNGNITNEHELRDIIEKEESRLFDKLGLQLKSTTDSELLLHSIALELYNHPDDNFKNIIVNSMKGSRGAYSIVTTIDDTLIAYKDSYGFRPLYMGEIGKDIVIFASEEIPIVNFAQAAGYGKNDVSIRSLNNGELIIAGSGSTIYENKQAFPKRKGRLCSFELAYLQSPDEKDAAELRKVLGSKLWERYEGVLNPKEDYYTVPVPKSGILYARGFSDASDIPYRELIGINEGYYLRSFMEHYQEARKKGVRDKYKFEESYKGKATFVTDDSIVRSNTIEGIIQGLRDGNIDELHIMVGTPQIVNPCWLGVQIPDTRELIAADLTKKQVEKYFESIFYGVEYEIHVLKALVTENKSVQSIVDQSILEGKNRYLDNLDMTNVVKGKFSLNYLTLKDFREAFDEIGINSKEICTACMQKNGSGYVPSMKKDLVVAGVI